MDTLIFLWLQNQIFYKKLQNDIVYSALNTKSTGSWADIGCSTGLITRIVQKYNFTAVGYDINNCSLFLAKLLSFNKQNIYYENKDFFDIKDRFDIVSAASLLSVVKDKERSLCGLLNLLKNKNSQLIIIEPTAKLTKRNVWKKIYNIKTFWYYKGLLLWAKAREGKHIDITLYKKLKNITFNQTYHIDDMISVTYIQKT